MSTNESGTGAALRNGYNASAALLQKVKARSLSYRPEQLCAVLERNGEAPTSLTFRWFRQAEGDQVAAFRKLSVSQEAAAETLLENGGLVETAEITVSRGNRVQLIKHFDDVAWCMKPDGMLAILDLDGMPYRAPALIDPKRREAAFDVRERLRNLQAAQSRDPVNINGVSVLPIFTDLNAVAIEMLREQAALAVA